MADESDDRAGEREVLTNLPRTRPARRSTRRTAAPETPAETPAKPDPAAARKPAVTPAAARKPAAKRSPAKPAAARRRTPPKPVEVVVPPVDATTAPATTAPPKPPPPLPASAPRAEHRSPMTDLAVTGIEATGELMRIGMDVTRAVLRATLGRLPRP